MEPIGKIIKEKNIQLETIDPVLLKGFTQVPNFILENPELTVGAKVAYSIFLKHAWNDDQCFPGQDRMAANMGMSRSRVTTFVGELQEAGLITIQRRGLTKTNMYTVHFQVKWAKRPLPAGGPPEVCRQTSRGLRVNDQRSTG